MRTFEDIDLLYVEDDPETRMSVSTMLKRRFKNIHVAENGQVGLEMYKKYKSSLIITDIKMPVMSGVEMIEHIRQDASGDPLVMVVTAHRESDLHSKLADVHLFKPIDLYQLLQTAKDLLIRSGKIAALP